MKKTEIVLIILIAVIIGVILSLTYNASTYITFADAEKNMGFEYTVIGELNKEKEIRFDIIHSIMSSFCLCHPLIKHLYDQNAR